MQIEDDTNQTILCGHLERSDFVYASSSEKVVLTFKSDYSVPRKGFRLHYHTRNPESMGEQDQNELNTTVISNTIIILCNIYTLSSVCVLYYSDYALAALASHGMLAERRYQTLLVSPTFTITEPHCLTIEVYSWQSFTVLMSQYWAHRTWFHPLLQASNQTGRAWHRIAVDLPIYFGLMGGYSALSLQTHTLPGSGSYIVAVDNVRIKPGRCQDDIGKSLFPCS